MSEAVHHPLFARIYALVSPQAEKAGVAGHRRELLEGLGGRVIEVGAGNGLNFAHYPPSVTEVVAVEPEPYLRSRAQEAAEAAPVPVRVVDGTADALPVGGGQFDAAVASLVLCSVPDQASALSELRRALRPGGELRFYEHVVAETPRRAAVQRRLDEWGVWPRVFGGCHVARDTVASIQAAGFAVERVRRFDFKSGPVSIPHVIGAARRP
jgi:SAM-dependent methyltransferase